MARVKKRYENEFPSVTEVTGALLPKDWEKYWFAKSVASAAVRSYLSAPAERWTGTFDGAVKWLTTQAAIGRKKVTDDSTVVGSGVHKALEKFLLGASFEESTAGLTNQQRSIFSRFTSLLSERKLKVVAVEEHFTDDVLKVNGTPDLIAREKKRLKVFDWKTSKKMDKTSYPYQMGGYAALVHARFGEWPEEGEVLRVGKDFVVDKPFAVPDLKSWAEKFIRLRGVYADIYGR